MADRDRDRCFVKRKILELKRRAECECTFLHRHAFGFLLHQDFSSDHRTDFDLNEIYEMNEGLTNERIDHTRLYHADANVQ